jgi:CBS domain-containing protein
MVAVDMSIEPALTIGADMSIAAARCMMAEFGVENLLVRQDGRRVGLVSIDDLNRSLPHRSVSEVMSRDLRSVGEPR